MAVRHLSEAAEFAGIIAPADTTIAPGNLVVAMQRVPFKTGMAAAIANTAKMNLRTELSLSTGIGASMKINAPTVF